MNLHKAVLQFAFFSFLASQATLCPATNTPEQAFIDTVDAILTQEPHDLEKIVTDLHALSSQEIPENAEFTHNLASLNEQHSKRQLLKIALFAATNQKWIIYSIPIISTVTFYLCARQLYELFTIPSIRNLESQLAALKSDPRAQRFITKAPIPHIIMNPRA